VSSSSTQEAVGVHQSNEDGRFRPSSTFRTLATHPAVWIGLIDVALILIFGAISPGHAFFNGGNFTNMALDSAEVVLIAAAISLLLGAAELDISVGANVILSSVVGGKVMVSLAATSEQAVNGQYPHLTLALCVGIPAALLTGALFGLVNGLIVTQLKVNSFITTLGMLGIGTGLSLVLTGGADIEGIPTPFQTGFGVNTVFAIPLPAIVAVVMVAVFWFVLAKTRFGLRTLAIGSSRETATRAGLRIDRHLIALFVLVGFCAGIAGTIDLSRFATTNLAGHQTDALAAIAGAVIGGTALFGGAVSVPGAVFGAILAVILETGLVIQGLSPFYQLISVGAILIGAVFIRGYQAEERKGGRLSNLTTLSIHRIASPRVQLTKSTREEI
jgi:ribose transport system permease protein